jgi:L-ascorbate metabolism protein UlaG (beta-lactamase superfamily)
MGTVFMAHFAVIMGTVVMGTVIAAVHRTGAVLWRAVAKFIGVVNAIIYYWSFVFHLLTLPLLLSNPMRSGLLTWHNTTMQITKLEHACLVLEHEGKKIIIDPGFYTRPMTDQSDVLAVVITHKHDDHCFEGQLDRILQNNPGVQIFGTNEVCDRLTGYSTTAVHHGDYYQVGPFSLEFFGDMHAEIHRSIPLIQNCGVMVNGQLYYPGDSFTRPDRQVEILACPSSAPWLKISEVIDFVADVKPKRSFATHNIHLSNEGHELNNSRIQATTEANGGSFEFLLPGEITTV